MNCVYRLIFNKRKDQRIMPYMYIGSKSNVIYENGIILNKNGTPYYGSSSYDNYSEIVKEEDIYVEIIKEFENYTNALNFESVIQKNLDVVADPRYFNLSIATVNNFTDPDYATYKHVLTGKTVRLPRNHPRVLSREYVGVTTGTVFSKEDRRKRARFGAENHFFGKSHSVETKQRISDANIGRKISNEQREWFIKNVAKMKKTPEHRAKIGRKGFVILKNKITREVIRVSKENKEEYDKNIWVNPYVLSTNKPIGSKWVTNGSENKKISKGETVPNGFRYGRTNKPKKNEDYK